MNTHHDDLYEETRFERIQRRAPKFAHARGRHRRADWQGIHRRRRARWCEHHSLPQAKSDRR